MPADNQPSRPGRGLRRLLAAAAITATAAALPTVAQASTTPTVVTVTHNATWGSILTLGNGDTVYRLTADPAGKSTCSGACAKAWPPVVLAVGQRVPVGHGVTGLSTIARAGGTEQVAYEGIPLYLFVGDTKAGQVNGNVKDTWGQWWVINPAHPHAVPKKAPGSTAATGAAY